MTKMKYARVRDSFDPRDKHYTGHLMGVQAAPSPLGLLLPRSADLRPGCSPVENQLNTNSCTGHAITAALEYDEIAELPEGQPFQHYSRLFVYYNERVLEGDPDEDGGAMIRDGIKSVAKNGICYEDLWPFAEDRVLLKPSMEAYQQAEAHKALDYQRVPQNVDAIKHVLGVQRRPIVFGITVYPSFESEQVAKTGIVPMPIWGETPIGGHAVLLVGYGKVSDFVSTVAADSPQDHEVGVVRNSWSEDWGLKGYFLLPMAYILSPQLAEDFWMVKRIT